MKKNTYILCLLLCIIFYSCNKENDSSSPDISGTWVVNRVDGEELNTNDVIVYQIGATTMKECFRDSNNDNSNWIEDDLSYTLSDDNISIYYKEFNRTFEIKIENYTDSSMEWRLVKVTNDNEVVYPNILYALKKEAKEYSKDIIGIWEGKCITPGEPNQLHRWEYFADGTYSYFTQNEKGDWVKKEGNNGHYKLYGSLLIASWNNDDLSGVEGAHCELWNINIVETQMLWSAVRNGSKVIEFQISKR